MLHLLRPQPLPPDLPVTVIIAFRSLSGAIPALLQPQNLGDGVSLMLIGVFLALIRERTGHLGWGIGLHAGWVLVIKLDHIYTHIAYSSPWLGLIGPYNGITGWLAAIWIGSLVLVVAYWPRSQ